MRYLIIISTLLLASCANPQQKYNSVASGFDNILQSGKACIDDTWENAEHIKRIFDVGRSDIPDDIIRSRKYMSKSDEKLLQNVLAERKECQKSVIEQLNHHQSPYMKNFIPVFTNYHTVSNEIFENYMDRKATTSQTAKNMKKIIDNANAQIPIINQQIANALNNEANQERAAWAAFGQAMSGASRDYQQQQQQYQQQYYQNRPVQTSCYWIGNSLQCTSR